MRNSWYFLIFYFVLAAHGQIPTPEDLETKAQREAIQDGIEMREVRESPAKDVGEALEKIDGLVKLRKGGIANDVVLRGFQSNNLNVLIDGVRIYGACPGHMDPAAFHVDFAEVDRIEVTKGGFDLANQGSMAGIINVIRKRPAPGFSFRPSLQTGSFGYVNPSAVASMGNERIEVLAGYSFRRSLPFRDGQGRRMTEGNNYRPERTGDDAFRVHTGWTNFRFSPATNQSGELSYTRQSAADVLYPYLQMDAPYDVADRLGATYEFRELGWAERLRWQGYYTLVRHWMTDERRLSSLAARDVFGMATFAGTRVLGGRGDLHVSPHLTVGGETFQRNWDAVNSFRTPALVADQNIIPNVNTTVAGAYAAYQRSLTDRIRVGGGVRLDTAHMYVRSRSLNQALFEAYKGETGLARRDTNPSGNARLTLGLTSNLEAFAGVATSVRVPDAQERFINHRRMGADWVGNPGLRPTRNNEANLGLNLRNGRWFVRALGFYHGLDNFIVVHNQRRRTPAPGVMNLSARSYDNVAARMYGGELSYGAALGRRWLVSGGAAMTRGLRDPRPELGIFSTNLPEVPPLKARLALRYGARTWFVQAEPVVARSQRRVDADLLEPVTPGWATLHLRAGWHARGWSVTAGADNLFDRFYYEHLSFQRDPFRSGLRVPEPGRNLYVNFGREF